MIGRVYAIALNTFRESIRNRVLYGILSVVVMVNLFGIVLGELSLNEGARVARDVGLGGIALFGAFTAIYLGVSLLYGEVNRRTIYNIVSKPIERWEFVVGKYLGIAVTLTLLVALFAASMALILTAQGIPVSTALIKAMVLNHQELLLVAAVAILFSSFSSPFLSGIFTFLVFFLGRVTPEIEQATASAAAWIRWIASAALRVVPDFHMFQVSGRVSDGTHVSVHGDFVSWGYVGAATGYAWLVIGMLLVASVLIFSRRDFA